MPAGGETGRVARRRIRRSTALAIALAGLASGTAQANTDITISNAATSNCSFFAGSPTIVTCSAATGTINRSEIESFLASGDVTVDAINGQAGTGTITINTGAGTPLGWSANTLTLQTSGAAANVAINSPVIVTGSGNLTVTTDGAITQTAPIINSNQVTLTADSGITLNSSNDFANLTASTGGAANDISVTDANAINLGSVAAGDDFSLTAGGSITQTAPATVGDTTNLNASGNPITMAAPNDFSGPVGFSGSDVVLFDANALTLDPGTATNNLTLVPNGALTQAGSTEAGKLTVGGTTTVVANGTSVGLPNPFNDFNGLVAIGSGTPASNTTVADADDLALGTSQITGTLQLLTGQRPGSGSHLTQVPSSTLTVNGSTTVAAGNASSDVRLTEANTLNGTIAVTGDANVRDVLLRSTSSGAAIGSLPAAPRDVAVTFDNAAVVLPALSMTGALNVQAGGAVTQTAAVSDTTGFAIAGGSLTLTNPANDFTEGRFEATAGDLSVREANSITLSGAEATGSSQVVAGLDLTVDNTPDFTANSMTLVADEAAGAGLGAGALIIMPGATLTSSGAPLKLYSAARPQNLIASNAMLNGATFTPGPEFVDSAREVWNTHFPAGTATSPFTIFYKQSGTPVPGDTTPPQTTIDSGPGAGSTISDPKPTFTFSSSEAGSAFACSVDGGPFAACSSSHTLASLADGQHTFAVAATDAAGNTDPTPASRTFTVDATAPDTSFTKTPKKVLKTRGKKARATFEFTADQAGSSFECSLDGAVFAPCASPHAFKVRVGPHRFLVRATDAAGNVDGSSAGFDFKVKRKRR